MFFLADSSSKVSVLWSPWPGRQLERSFCQQPYQCHAPSCPSPGMTSSGRCWSSVILLLSSQLFVTPNRSVVNVNIWIVSVPRWSRTYSLPSPVFPSPIINSSFPVACAHPRVSLPILIPHSPACFSAPLLLIKPLLFSWHLPSSPSWQSARTQAKLSPWADAD